MINMFPNDILQSLMDGFDAVFGKEETATLAFLDILLCEDSVFAARLLLAVLPLKKRNLVMANAVSMEAKRFAKTEYTYHLQNGYYDDAVFYFNTAANMGAFGEGGESLSEEFRFLIQSLPATETLHPLTVRRLKQLKEEILSISS